MPALFPLICIFFLMELFIKYLKAIIDIQLCFVDLLNLLIPTHL